SSFPRTPLSPSVSSSTFSCTASHLWILLSMRIRQKLASLSFLFLSRSSGRSGARPLDLRVLRILLPVTKCTWATPWDCSPFLL
uniref:Uncharacterized protein n=1 Tax=Oryzias sinensis TaxID=183150 RepID=A0A8C7ZIS6_9TELE